MGRLSSTNQASQAQELLKCLFWLDNQEECGKLMVEFFVENVAVVSCEGEKFGVVVL